MSRLWWFALGFGTAMGVAAGGVAVILFALHEVDAVNDKMRQVVLAYGELLGTQR